MPETRYTELYKDGKLISRTPVIISDEQIEREGAVARLQALSSAELKKTALGQAILDILWHLGIKTD